MSQCSKKFTSQVDKRHIGKLGEEIIVRHLLASDYTIVYKNFLIKGSEIDIVAKKDDVLYLCEVKTIQMKSFIDTHTSKIVSRETYPIWQNITKKKIQNMKRSVSQIRKNFSLFHETVRFFGFIVKLDVKHKKAEITTIPDINI